MTKYDIVEYLNSSGYVEYRSGLFALAEDIEHGRVKTGKYRFKLLDKVLRFEKNCRMDHSNKVFWVKVGSYYYSKLSINLETGKLKEVR